MSGINQVSIIGNLGNDPEMATIPSSGTAVCKFQVATSEQWKDKNSGEKREETEWHRIVGFDRLGEICSQYLTKGSKVFVSGRLKTRRWDDKETGKKMQATEIIANKVEFLDSRADRAETKANDYAPSSRQNPNGSQKSYTAPPQETQPIDDDIPF